MTAFWLVVILALMTTVVIWMHRVETLERRLRSSADRVLVLEDALARCDREINRLALRNARLIAEAQVLRADAGFAARVIEAGGR